jgi:hypothetical protein
VIIEAHSGRLWVSPDDQDGTVLHIILLTNYVRGA